MGFRIIFTFLLCSLFLPCTCVRAQGNEAQSKTPLQLRELQQQASVAALNVLTARQQLEAASLNLDAFEASLKPSLDLAANLPNYFRTSREVTLDDGTIGFREIELNNSFVGLFASQRIAATGGIISLESRLQRTDNLVLDNKNYQGSPVRLSIRQPLLAFNPWKWNRELLPMQKTVRERELAAAGADAALEATDRFFDLVSADQERRIAEINKTANEQLYTVAEERYELGKINRGDLVQLRLELTSAEQNLLRAERLVAAASANIQRLLGRAYTGEVFLPVLPEVNQQATIDKDRALGHLNARRPEIMAARLRQTEANRDVDQAKKDFGPRIDIEAGFGLVRSDPQLAPIYSDPQGERIVSVNLSLPILDWGERRARVRSANANAELAREIARRTELDLGTELLQLLEQWRTVQEELRLAAEIRDLANERFAISKESYELGAIPLAELSLAQQFRDRNIRAYADTLRAYWRTYAQLARLTLWDFINDRELGS